jgi:molybdopterin-guanine dinucleotide biosynthesis protein A
MGGEDKALACIGRRRLIDLVVERLAPQADLIVISGGHDYGTGLPVVPDRTERPKGPAAGVFAVAGWLMERDPTAVGFVTTPVDGPFLPQDLFDRLGASQASAIAVDDEGVHPTFAYWDLLSVQQAQAELGDQPVSLRLLARTCGAREVRWLGARHFRNINTPTDLKSAAVDLG